MPHKFLSGFLGVLFVSFALPQVAYSQSTIVPWQYPVTMSDHCYKTGVAYYGVYSPLISNEKHHTGVDIGCDATVADPVNIMASAPGTVYLVANYWQTYKGLSVFIYHGDDAAGFPVFSFYTHMSAAVVKKGDVVTTGQIIGTMGYTPGGRHVHWGYSNIYPEDFPTYEWHAIDHGGRGWLDPITMIDPVLPKPLFVESTTSFTPPVISTAKTTSTLNSDIIIVVAVVVIVCLLVLMILSKDFRKIAFGGIVVCVFSAGIYYYFLPAITKKNDDSFTANPRNTSFTPTISEVGDSFAPLGNCTLPLAYEETVRRYCPEIQASAAKYDVLGRMIAAVMTQESHGDPNAYSFAGATCLMQVMPSDGIAADLYPGMFTKRPTIAWLSVPANCVDYATSMLKGLGINEDPFNALFHYGPTGESMLKQYGDYYYYPKVVLGIFNTYK